MRYSFARTWAELTARWYPGDPFRPDEAARRYYETKFDIVRRCSVSRILEIGVRAGYSAFVFLRAAQPGATYLGIDNGLCDAESGNEYIAHARRLLDGWPARIWVTQAQSLNAWPRAVDQFHDFVHVDGDHTMSGCLHDLVCSAEQANYILVDDYDTGPLIRAACAEFLKLGTGWRTEHIPDGGLAGNLLLTRST